MRQHLVLVFQFHLKHRVRQRLNHYCHHFNRVFFAHVLLSSQFPVLSNNGAPVSSNSSVRSHFQFCNSAWLFARATELSYSVKITGPSLVTATQCSKCAL